MLLYLFCDYITAALAWGLFFMSRKYYIESPKYGVNVFLEINHTLILGVIIIPICWICLYYFSGYYRNIHRKSRLNDFIQTLSVTFIGALFIFFFLILDDVIINYKNYYDSFYRLILYHFTLTLLLRFIITSFTNYKIHHNKIRFNTLVIGNNGEAVNCLKELNSRFDSANGNYFVGYVEMNNPHPKHNLSKYIPRLGRFDDLNDIIEKQKIEEVVIAIEPGNNDDIITILDKLDFTDVSIKATYGLYDDIKGKAKVKTLFGTSLIEVAHDLIPPWQQNVKQLIDIVVALFSVLILSPLFIFLIICIKITSRGPIFFRQVRIGKYGKPFTLFKFRSMSEDAEKEGPRLSRKDDDRMTSFGKFMRRTKLDELPNFFNVLLGNMSLVGPRPERQYYIDEIIKKAPHYIHLLKVKPGITSLGQVKFGYAECVDEMIMRLRYDIIYLENMSIFLDFKILFYTIFTVMKGKGV